MTWLIYALMTVAAWGVYGIFLNFGHSTMNDKDNGLYKAFLFVGIAYFLTAVIAPLAMLYVRRSTWDFTAAGSSWSLIAGIVGAIGAFCVLLAFKAGGTPSVVMAIVFAGAPIVNALVAIALSPPEGGWGSIRWPFYAGILLAAVGGGLVTFYKPALPPKPAGHGPAASRAGNSQFPHERNVGPIMTTVGLSSRESIRDAQSLAARPTAARGGG